jgi:2-phospho-L-lactate transferase/gluconeogenesis factor (CofD/UPF0052 family)
VRHSHATRVYVCNVANMRGETHGLDAADHVEALQLHGLDGCIDVALVHACSGELRPCADDVEPVVTDEAVLARIGAMGVRVLVRDLADPGDPVRHDRSALGRALGEVLS